MNISSLFKPAFFGSLLFGFVGVLLKFLHVQGVDIILILSAIFTVVYVVSAIYEIHSSSRIQMNEKLMWTCAFILLSMVAGLVYYFMGRRRIMR